MARHVIVAIIALGVTAPSPAQEVVSYTGDSFPEDSNQNWVRREHVHLADRWIDNGWLVQAPILLPCPPQCTTEDSYERDLTDQIGPNWLLRWVMETDGPLAIGAVAPSRIAMADEIGVLYHFTIGQDEVAFQRDPQIPLVTARITPGPHEYTVELHNQPPPATFCVRIDGEEIASGIAEGPFPSQFDSIIAFGAQAALEDSITRWDLIEFGPIEPEPIPAVSTWGVTAMALLTMTVATVVLRRQRKHTRTHAHAPATL